MGPDVVEVHLAVLHHSLVPAVRAVLVGLGVAEVGVVVRPKRRRGQLQAGLGVALRGRGGRLVVEAPALAPPRGPRPLQHGRLVVADGAALHELPRPGAPEPGVLRVCGVGGVGGLGLGPVARASGTPTAASSSSTPAPASSSPAAGAGGLAGRLREPTVQPTVEGQPARDVQLPGRAGVELQPLFRRAAAAAEVGLARWTVAELQVVEVVVVSVVPSGAGVGLSGGAAAHVVGGVVLPAQAAHGGGGEAAVEEDGRGRRAVGQAQPPHGTVRVIGLGQHRLPRALLPPADDEEDEEGEGDDGRQDDAHVEEVVEHPGGHRCCWWRWCGWEQVMSVGRGVEGPVASAEGPADVWVSVMSYGWGVVAGVTHWPSRQNKQGLLSDAETKCE